MPIPCLFACQALSGSESGVCFEGGGRVTLPLCCTSGHSAGHCVTGREGRDFPSEPSSHSLRRHRAAPETISSVCSEMDRSDSSDQNCSPPLIRTILRVRVVGNVSDPIRSNTLVHTQICWQPVDGRPCVVKYLSYCKDCQKYHECIITRQ